MLARPLQAWSYAVRVPQILGMGASRMPRRNLDLHGNAPDKADVALLLIDVINDLEFPEGDHSCGTPADGRADRRAEAAGEEQGIPVIYVNDNFGRWRSNFNAQVDHCLEDGVRGRPLARAPAARGGRLLRPQAQALRVLLDDASTSCSTTSRLSS